MFCTWSAAGQLLDHLQQIHQKDCLCMIDCMLVYNDDISGVTQNTLLPVSPMLVCNSNNNSNANVFQHMLMLPIREGLF